MVVQGAVGELSGLVIRGRYEVLGLLGSGGMAEVYAARFLPSKNRHVAIKFLRRCASDPATVKRFKREFEILYDLQHPNLVVAHDLDCTRDGQHFMVLERLHGRSLDKLKGALPAARVIVIARQILSAVDHLHRASVIHRDLKPANVILLDGSGGMNGARRAGGADGVDGADEPTDRVKLLDLGIARLQPGWYWDDRPYMTPVAERELTETGIIMGTRRYVPPEAADSPPTPLWDIYALGVLLWTIARGGPPPLEWRQSGVMRAAPEGRFGLPKLLERALRDAMSVDPERRFASAADFLEVLDEVEADLTDPKGMTVGVVAGVHSGDDVNAEPDVHAEHGSDGKNGEETSTEVETSTQAKRARQTEHKNEEPARTKQPATVKSRLTMPLVVVSCVLAGWSLRSLWPETQGLSAHLSEHARVVVRSLDNFGSTNSAAIEAGPGEAGIDVTGDAESRQAESGRESIGVSTGAAAGAGGEPATAGAVGAGVKVGATAVDARPRADASVDANSSADASRSEAAFRRQIGQHENLLRQCMFGLPKLRFQVKLSAQGRVLRVQAEGASPLAELCLNDAFVGIKFAAASGGSTHTLTLTLTRHGDRSSASRKSASPPDGSG